MSQLIDKPWFEKYRAKDINEYIFPNEEIKNFALNAYENEKIPCNTLFYGKPGLGKSNLAQVLIKKVIKHKNDLFIIKDRSVKEIDQIKVWIQKPPVKSKQKIVFAEESDRILQSKQAIAELKTITEKYLDHTIFFFITNYISKFISTDKALVTRFTCRFNFDKLPEEEVIKKLKYILEQENIQYNEEDLIRFVKENIDLGLRDLINKMQILSLDGTFKYSNNIQNLAASIEDEIVNDIHQFINELFAIPPSYYQHFNTLSNIYIADNLAKVYTKLTTRLQNDTLLDYEYILYKLTQEIQFLPLYQVTLKYLEELETKKYKNLHIISMLYEYIRTMQDFA